LLQTCSSSISGCKLIIIFELTINMQKYSAKIILIIHRYFQDNIISLSLLKNVLNGFFFKIFILHNSRCQVLCGSCKKLPRTSFSVVIFFCSFGIVNASTVEN
jgi:hypothetical protein